MKGSTLPFEGTPEQEAKLRAKCRELKPLGGATRHGCNMRKSCTVIFHMKCNKSLPTNWELLLPMFTALLRFTRSFRCSPRESIV